MFSMRVLLCKIGVSKKNWKRTPNFRIPKIFHIAEGHGWSRLVTVGHGRSRVSPYIFSIGRFFLVTVGHGWSRSSFWLKHFARHWKWTRIGYQNWFGLCAPHGSVQACTITLGRFVKIALSCTLPTVCTTIYMRSIGIAIQVLEIILAFFLAKDLRNEFGFLVYRKGETGGRSEVTGVKIPRDVVQLYGKIIQVWATQQVPADSATVTPCKHISIS